VLIVVRHGRTTANREGRLLGRLDVDLDDEGRRQAAALARAVGPVDRIISSPLRRTHQTAEAWGSDVELDERWIELDYGDYDGVPMTDVDDEVWARWRADPTFAPPCGESLTDLGARVRTACEDLADEAAERDVVVVTHVSPIKAAAAWALGVGDDVAWRMYVAPASVMQIGISANGPSLRAFNIVGHLDSPGV
jgi:broad specificity phosphatase PhoE